MSDFQAQLAQLRSRVAKIDAKFANAAPRVASSNPVPYRPARYFPEDWLNGHEVETEFGKHFESEKLYERQRRHGSIGITDLESLPHDLLAPISGAQVRNAPPQRWCFLDTETTGLAGGAGTYAFLVGVGRIAADGFRVRQFFMRDFDEEASLLAALTAHLAEFDVLVTYNGKTYDRPLLETRYRMARAKPPFAALDHLDLLHGARRLWKLRFDSCRLVDLENQILGVEREGDLPGEMIPYVYFEYLRSGEPFRLMPIFHHNAMDILTLACLTAVVPWAFHPPDSASFTHGAEMVGLARWWRQAGEHENALALFRRGVERGLGDELLFRTLWDIAALEKKLGRELASVAVFTELAATRNPWRACAYEELAKYYEHRERNYGLALEMARSAIDVESTEVRLRRKARLERRLVRGKNGTLPA